MRGIHLLLKNAFRSSWRRKSQIFGLSLLVMLVSLIMSVLAATTTRVMEAEELLIRESNQRDAIMDVDTSIRLKDPTNGRPETGETFEGNTYNYDYKLADGQTLTDNQHLYQQYILNQIGMSSTKSALAEDIKFEFTRTEGRMLTSLQNNGQNIKIKAVTKTNSKNDYGVDQLVVSTGRNYQTINEVVIGESFARENNIKIGDIIRVQEDTFGNSILVKNSDDQQVVKDIAGKSIEQIFQMGAYANMVWFEVVGFGASSDFITPLFDETTVIPNVQNEAIVYMAPENLGLIASTYNFVANDGSETIAKKMYTYNVASARIVVTSEYDIESSYSIKFQNGNSNNKLDRISEMYYYFAGIDRDVKFFYDNYDNDYRFSGRLSTFETITNGYNIMATLLLIVVLLIALFAIVLTTKKQVDAMSKQIGCLKSLGYKKREVVNNFIAVPLIVSIVGSIIGYLISIFVENSVVGIFSNYFNVAFYGFAFNVWSFLASILFLWIILTAISFAIGYFVIRHSALRLLNGRSDKIMGRVSRSIKKANLRNGFNSRLRTALLTTNMGKMIGVSATMLLSTLLMTTTIIAPKVMADNKKASFNGMNYENMVSYTQPIANNPFSFYRTYTPNKVEGWGTYQDVTGIHIGTKNETKNGKTAYPIKDINGTKTYDWDKIIEDLINGNIDASFYQYDIVDLATYWAQMSYLNWRNLSTDFLINMDKLTDLGLFDAGLAPLASQWPDYVKIKSDIKAIPNVLNSENLKSYAETMLWFYNKYTNGVKVVFNNKIVNNTTLAISTGSINSQLESDLKKSNLYSSFTNINDFIKPLETAEAKIMVIDDEGNYYDPNTINKNDIAEMSEKELLELNASFAFWFSGTFSKRIGYIILETAYSRAPYFVQEYIKEAMNDPEGKYNIAFNTVPYDKEKETIGTSLNVQYKSKVGKLETANIFGLKNEDKNLVVLEDSNNNDLLDDLFIESSDEYVPIVINETISTKTGKDSGDIIDFDILRDLIYSGETKTEVDLNDVDFGFKKPLTSLKSNSSRGYYSQTGTFSDTGLFSIPDTFEPATINGRLISNKDALNATNQTDIHKAYQAGEIYINTILENKKFKIVGVQNGYGQAQAWIDNQKANEILDYDSVQAKIFTNWFAQEYKNAADFETIFTEKYSEDGSDVIAKLKTVSMNNDDSTVSKTIFEEFKKLAAESNENSGWVAIFDLFNNLYPIFNYKYSANKEMLDLTQGFSTAQRFADFSSQGLNGNYTMKKDDEGNPTSEIDPSKYVEGFGIGTLATMLPMEQTRQILGQITEVINVIIIMFIVIALIVSITIILLTTSLIIYENKQFIATMKTLGYSSRYVVRQILGMYIGPVLIMFIGGFIGGWFIFTMIANFLALYTTFVLPVIFYWWLPFAVFGVIATIYAITFGSGWLNISKIDPVVALKTDD